MDINLEYDRNSEEMNNSLPKIFCTLPPLLLKQNHPASIPIKVTGSPSPTIHWFIRGVPVDQCIGYIVSTGPGRKSHPDEILTVLEISSVDQLLEGGVEVVAENARGTDRFVVPLKTYRLLSGIYMEEERNKKEREGKGFDGNRTVDRRLFRNEVDEACRGIKIYQAYSNVSKLHDNCHSYGNNVNSYHAAGSDDDDPEMKRWKRDMAKRNLMKSIDDIIDSFDENPEGPSRARTLGSQTPGNSSFRSETIPHTQPDLIQTGSRSFSLQRGRGWAPIFRPPRIPQKRDTNLTEPVNGSEYRVPNKENSLDQMNKNTLFSFYGQKLSKFCERLLHTDDNVCRNIHFKGRPEMPIDVATNNVVVDEEGSCDVYERIDDFELHADFVLDQLIEGQLVDISPSNILENKNEDCTVQEAQFIEFTKDDVIDKSEDFKIINDASNESIERTDQSSVYELEQIGHDSFVAAKHRPTEINDFEKFQREDLKSILTNLNEQLEKWKVESKREDSMLTRTNSRRFRNPHCRSENFEGCSITEFSDYSKSLNELTEKLTNFDDSKNEKTFFNRPLLPLKENFGTNDAGCQSPIASENPNHEGRIGLVKPQIAKKPVCKKKPEVPLKPKLLMDRRDNHGSNVMHDSSMDAELRGGDDDDPNCNSDATVVSPRAVEMTLSPSSSISSSSHVSSSNSSSWSSRSFTPSPNQASNAADTSPFSSSTSKSSPLVNSPSSSPPSSSPSSSPPSSSPPSSSSPSCLNSSFSLSPPTNSNSTKYKLVKPPSPLILSEVASSSSSSPTSSTSSSPFLPPPPFSCPPSIEMTRKMDDAWFPSKSRKSFKILKVPRRSSKTSSMDGNYNSTISGSVGNVNKSREPPRSPIFTSTRSVEILPERKDSFASMEKYRSINNSRRALSKKYELVIITTQDETVTLKGRDDSEFKSKEGRVSSSPNESESMNAAERLYYLLGGSKNKESGGDYDDDDDGVRSYPEGSKRIKIEAYRLPRDELKGREVVDDGNKKRFHNDESYEDLVSSLISLAKDQ